MTRAIPHAAIEYVPEPDARPECRVCGRPTFRTDEGTVRHIGERFGHFTPDVDDIKAFTRVEDVVKHVVSSLPGYPTDQEIARAVATALYKDGMLRQRRKPAARPAVLAS